MSIKIEWNEDKTKATISKDYLETLQGNFDKGFGKGKESGRKEGREEVLSAVKPLGITEENLETAPKTIAEDLTKFRSGKIDPKILEESDVVKNLKEQLEKKDAHAKKLEESYNSFRQSQLIDSKIKDLAAENKAVDISDVLTSFKQNYSIELGKDDNIVIKNEKGTPLFNDKGDELTLSDVFKQFSAKKPHLFQAGGQNGGSGGGGGTPPSNVKFADLKTDADKAKYVEQHGLEAYQKLVQQNFNG